MTTADLIAPLEAILFVAGEAVSVERLRAALSCDAEELERTIAALREQLQSGGIRLQRGTETVQLVSAPELSGPVERFLGIQAAGKPSAAALETLAIVAYHQPVSRGQIEEIRGVSCERVLKSLGAQGLIQEVGRGTGLGRPVLYGTTDDFLQRFGLESLARLPELE